VKDGGAQVAVRFVLGMTASNAPRRLVDFYSGRTAARRHVGRGIHGFR
jgi:hypothetical protein